MMDWKTTQEYFQHITAGEYYENNGDDFENQTLYGEAKASFMKAFNFYEKAFRLAQVYNDSRACDAYSRKEYCRDKVSEMSCKETEKNQLI